MKKNIIIAGVNGFIGTSFKLSFEKKYNIVDYFSNSFSPNNHYEALFCFASRLKPNANSEISDLNDDISCNLQIFDFFLKNKNIDKFIFLSSAGALDGDLILNNYALSKHFMEKCIFKNSNSRNSIVLRCSNIYGSSQKFKNNQGIIPKLIECYQNSDAFNVWGDGETKKNYLYIDDLITLLDKVIQTKLNSVEKKPFFVASEKNYSINDLIKITDQIVRKKLIIEYTDAAVTDKSNINKFDITKTFNVFNWKPKYNLYDGIKKIFLETL